MFWQTDKKKIETFWKFDTNTFITFIYIYLYILNAFKTEKGIVLHLFQPGAEDRDK